MFPQQKMNVMQGVCENLPKWRDNRSFLWMFAAYFWAWEGAGSSKVAVNHPPLMIMSFLFPGRTEVFHCYCWGHDPAKPGPWLLSVAEEEIINQQLKSLEIWKYERWWTSLNQFATRMGINVSVHESIYTCIYIYIYIHSYIYIEKVSTRWIDVCSLFKNMLTTGRLPTRNMCHAGVCKYFCRSDNSDATKLGNMANHVWNVMINDLINL